MAFQRYIVTQDQKRAAAGSAVAANEAAALFAASAALTMFSPIAAAAFGLASAGAWRLGNAYQRIANDPPRRDFHIIASPLSAQLASLSYPRVATEITIAKATEDYSLLTAESTQAANDLVKTLERVMGAEIEFYNLPTRQLFNAVNAQRRTTKEHIATLKRLLEAQTTPREYLRINCPAFVASVNSIRPGVTELRTLHKSAGQAIDKLRRVNGLSRLPMQPFSRMGFSDPYTSARWDTTFGTSHQKN